MGIHIDGAHITTTKVTVDDTFEKCPIAWAVGIPLMVKRLEEKSKYNGMASMYLVVRLMGDADTGLVPAGWQYGGINGPAPPVVAERSDGIPFTTEEWAVLDNFLYNWPWDDEKCRRPTRDDFVASVASQMSCALINHLPAHSFLDVWENLPKRYPLGSQVKATGLTSEIGLTLNGQIGTVNGKYEGGRIGVKFPKPFNVKALKPANLLPSMDFEEASEALMKSYQ